MTRFPASESFKSIDPTMIEDTEFDVRRILSAIRRRLRMITVTMVVLVGAAVLAILTLTPLYIAEVLVFIDPTHKNLLDPSSQFSMSPSANSLVDSEVEIIRSAAVLGEVVRDQHLVDDAELGVHEGLRERVLSALRFSPVRRSKADEVQITIEHLSKKLDVQRLGTTFVVAISIESKEPAKAADLVNAVAETYIRMQVSAKIDSVLAARDVLTKRIDLASASIRDAEDVFEQFISKNLEGISDSPGSTRLSELRDRLTSIRGQRETALASMQGLSESIERNDWNSVAAALHSEAIRQLGGWRDELEKEIGAMPPEQAQINLREELRRIDGELREAATSGADGLQRQVQEHDRSLDNLRQELRSAVLESDLPTDILTKVYQLQQNSEVARSQYQTLLGRLRDMETQADLQVADSRIVSAALPPADPSFPKTKLLIGSAVLVSAVVALLLAFLYENYLGGFVSEEQVRSVLGVGRVFGVPLHATASGAGDLHTLPDTVIEAPFSSYSEAVRRIWVAIEQMREARVSETSKPKAFVVMISSAAPAEGKTSLVISIARMAALEGLRTLLIDCDLRKPTVHRNLGLEVKTGLGGLLGADLGPDCSFAEATSIDAPTGLSVLGGRRAGDPAFVSLSIGERLPKVLDALASRYDIVFIDTPPVGPVADGLYLAPSVDAVVFSIEWARTPQREVKAALEALRLSSNRPSSVICVLNKRGNDELIGGTRYKEYYRDS